MFELGDFVDSIIKENKQFAAVDDADVLDMVKENLMESIDDHINAMILAEMPPGKLVKFETIVDSGDQEAISAFVSANIPNLDIKLTQLLIDFKKSYLGE